MKIHEFFDDVLLRNKYIVYKLYCTSSPSFQTVLNIKYFILNSPSSLWMPLVPSNPPPIPLNPSDPLNYKKFHFEKNCISSLSFWTPQTTLDPMDHFGSHRSLWWPKEIWGIQKKSGRVWNDILDIQYYSEWQTWYTIVPGYVWKRRNID